MARKQLFPRQFSLMEIGVCTSWSQMSLSTIMRYLPNAALVRRHLSVIVRVCCALQTDTGLLMVPVSGHVQ